MNSFILIFKGIQQYGFYNHFVVAILVSDKPESVVISVQKFRRFGCKNSGAAVGSVRR